MKYRVLLCLLILCGCSRQPLELFTDNIGIEQYASYHVGTPDPNLDCPEFGQILVTKWDLPPQYMCYPNLHIFITVRFYDGSTETLDYPIYNKSGQRTWKLLNERWKSTGGIATFKAELISDQTPLLCWKHTLWNETITVGEDDFDTNFQR